MKEMLEYQSLELELLKLKKESTSSENKSSMLKYKNYIAELNEKGNELETAAKSLYSEYESLQKEYNRVLKNIDSLVNIDMDKVDANDVDEFYANSNTYSSELYMIRRNLDGIIKKIKDMLDEFKNTKNNIIKAKTKFADSKKQYDDEIEKITPKCNEIKKKMIDLQDKIDKATFAKYQAIKNDKIFPVFVKIRDNHCGGCRVELPMAKVNKLKAEKMIVCDQCHRIIITE
ncbi:MAG: hypothetical protein J6V40_00860 [Clostridia bacterium]|nr:hypothetical protein [Clostridia bacterium]